MNELKFLQVLLLQIDSLMKDTHEEHIKFSRLKQIKEEIEERIDSINYEKENVKISKIIKKYNLTESEKSYLRVLNHNAEIGFELKDPIDEYENKNYFIRREAFVSSYDGNINYGFTLYKWDGTYDEKPLTPNNKKTFKWKNWVEIFHTLTEKKASCKEMLKAVLGKIEITKEVADEN